jgi:hypothetical protein
MAHFEILPDDTRDPVSCFPSKLNSSLSLRMSTDKISSFIRRRAN